MQECCKNNESLLRRKKFDRTPPQNPLTNARQNLHRWIPVCRVSEICSTAPSNKILSKSDKGLCFYMQRLGQKIRQKIRHPRKYWDRCFPPKLPFLTPFRCDLYDNCSKSQCIWQTFSISSEKINGKRLYLDFWLAKTFNSSSKISRKPAFLLLLGTFTPRVKVVEDKSHATTNEICL